MNSILGRMDALLFGAGLALLSFPAIAHEGHTLDLLSAFLAPLAGWDHLLMAGLFLAVLVGMVRAMAKAVKRKTRMHRGDDQ